MPKKKTETVAAYYFRQTVTYAPLADKEYAAGTVEALSDWDAGAVVRALQAGLIEEARGEVASPPAELEETAGEEDNK